MVALSRFQEQCESSLMQTLKQLGLAPNDRRLEGEHEPYIHAHLSAQSIEIWIYTNEAMFSTAGKSYAYEKPDYPDDRDRVRAFVEAVAACAKGSPPSDTGSARLIVAKGKRL